MRRESPEDGEAVIVVVAGVKVGVGRDQPENSLDLPRWGLRPGLKGLTWLTY
jgi:hypothetical protein